MCNGNERVKGSACANDVISLLARRPIARAMLASKEEAEKSSSFIEANSKGLSEARAASMKEVETQRSIKVTISSGKKPMVEKNQGQRRYTTPYVKRINGRLCWVRSLAKKVD